MQPVRRQALMRRASCREVKEPNHKWESVEMRLGRPATNCLVQAKIKPMDKGHNRTKGHELNHEVGHSAEIVLIRDWRRLVVTQKHLPSLKGPPLCAESPKKTHPMHPSLLPAAAKGTLEILLSSYSRSDAVCVAIVRHFVSIDFHNLGHSCISQTCLLRDH